MLKAKGELGSAVEDSFTLPNIDGNYKSTDGKVVPFPYSPEKEVGASEADVTIVPFIGLVLKCCKNNIHDKEPVYINICHHTALVRPENNAYYMLSSPSESVAHPTSKLPCSVYKIVVHSEILDFMLKDKSGDARDQVCIHVCYVLLIYI